MTELLERLEKATGPNRELDNLIWFALDQPLPDDPVGIPLPYTASVDAALTLVPPHHLWEVKQGIEARAVVWQLCVDYDEGGHDVPCGYSTTFPAIALCIAALRARAALRAEEVSLRSVDGERQS